MKKLKILFLLKNRSSYGVSYGLKNSCIFVSKALEKLGYDCKVEEIIDTTFIDRGVLKELVALYEVKIFTTPAQLWNLLLSLI
jgi:hypothetical protein